MKKIAQGIVRLRKLILTVAVLLLIPSAIGAIATRINTAARSLELNEEGKPALSASIGIALSPAHGTTYADLLHNADQALYQTKENGRDNWTLAFYKNQQ